jgi:hypothetical protein
MDTPKSKIDEAMEEYDRLHNIPVDVTDSITHAEFVAGMRNQTVNFAITGGDPMRLVSGAGRAFFTVFFLLYLIAPILVIPFWAYQERNWWLLLGIIVASLIAPQLAQLKRSYIGGLFFLASLIFLFTKGLHSYYTFFSLCAFSSYLFFRLAEAVQASSARQTLIDSPECFRRETAAKGIYVWRRRDLSSPV